LPSTVKIAKEEIIAAAFEITKEQGIEAATARAIAKRLQCSVQPVYYVFETMANMREAVLEKANQKYAQILFSNIPNVPIKAKAVGLNYLRFAKEYPNLFKLIFATDRYEHMGIFDTVIDDNKHRLIRLIMDDCGIKDPKRAEDIYVKIGIFCYGLAMAAVLRAIRIDDESTARLIEEVFAGILKA